MADELKYNVPLNLLGLEIRNATFQILAAAPSTKLARFYYDSVLQTGAFWNNTEWVPMDARLRTGIPVANLATNPLARSNHTGTQLASTISDFDTQVRTSRLDQMAVPTTALLMNNQRITGLATPTGAADAATKAYVDGASTTGNAATATKLATARTFSLTGLVTAPGVTFDGSGNVTLNTAIADGALTIAKTAGLQGALDGKQAALGYVPVNKAGDSMLGALTLAADPINPLDAATKQYVDNVAAQAAAGIDPKEAVLVATTTNIALTGIQTIDGVSAGVGKAVLVKNQTNGAENGIYVVGNGAWTRRADATQDKLTRGALVLVTDGTTQKGFQFWLQTDDPITVGTTSQSWIQFNAVTAYTASNGVQLIGNDFRAQIKGAGGLGVDSSGLFIDTSIVSRKKSADLGDGVTTAFNFAHNLNTLDVTVSLRNKTTNEIEYAGIGIVDANNVSITFATGAPAAASYRVTVSG